MERFLCIHGHFYQPPREDPWLGVILPEGSAAPAENWNERIGRESYAPLGWARRLADNGRIADIFNCYEWISFNFGPTLLSWMERCAPQVYARVLEGDRRSRERWGRGNAMAQVYHHVILPLATDMDKRLEIAWGMDDFRARYGRDAEGMWLAEAAVDTATLEAAAECGLAYTVLAPRQAAAVAPLVPGEIKGEEFRPVDESSLDVSQPYLVVLPSGRSIAVFFYNGPISQAVAFERLLQDGEGYWRKISGSLGPGLLSVATDGETYGHHFTYGEMALAYVVEQAAAGRDKCVLTNFGAHLEARPPLMRVRLHEPSSWSCVHGVERWRTDCGCVTGDHPEWNQRWRAPLRQALDRLKTSLDGHFFERGAGLFWNPARALLEYGKVLAGSLTGEDFSAKYLRRGLTGQEVEDAWKLLAMEQWALASFASCAWFFDDLARIEPVNGLTYGLRALELAGRSGMVGVEQLEAEVTAFLERAESNQPGKGTGRDIWERDVRPRRETGGSLAVQALTVLRAEGRLPPFGGRAKTVWPGVTVEVCVADGAQDLLWGEMIVQWRHEASAEQFGWEWERPTALNPADQVFRVAPAGEDPAIGRAFRLADLPWNKRQAVAVTWARAAGASEWLRTAKLGGAGAGLFLPYEYYQKTQIMGPEWAGLWPGLVAAWVRSGRGEADMVRFLREAGLAHPAREAALARLVEEIDGVLAAEGAEGPDWGRAAGMIGRLIELDLRTDLWRLQNRIWGMRPLPEAGKRVAQLLWFAEGAV